MSKDTPYFKLQYLTRRAANFTFQCMVKPNNRSTNYLASDKQGGNRERSGEFSTSHLNPSQAKKIAIDKIKKKFS